MSDEQQAGGVRRFGRRDRKQSLKTRGSLFPTETEPISSEVVPEADPPEVSGIPALEMPDMVPSGMPTQNVPSRKSTPMQGKQILANLLTVIFLLATVGLIGVIGIITTNPYTPLNPFPPFTPIPIIITATFLPPTETPIGTAIPTETFTPVAVDASSTGSAAFGLVGDAPIYAPNANDKGCNWSSIAGTVTDQNGGALDGYRVHIAGNGVDETVFSGATATFGAGGFELFLNGTPQSQTYSVQLLDPQSKPLSSVYQVTTQDKCDQNVAILQFKAQQ